VRQGKIACDFSCEHDGELLSARLDFNIHMVGLNNGTYDAPSLQTVCFFFCGWAVFGIRQRA